MTHLLAAVLIVGALAGFGILIVVVEAMVAAADDAPPDDGKGNP